MPQGHYNYVLTKDLRSFDVSSMMAKGRIMAVKSFLYLSFTYI